MPDTDRRRGGERTRASSNVRAATPRRNSQSRCHREWRESTARAASSRSTNSICRSRRLLLPSALDGAAAAARATRGRGDRRAPYQICWGLRCRRRDVERGRRGRAACDGLPARQLHRAESVRVRLWLDAGNRRDRDDRSARCSGNGRQRHFERRRCTRGSRCGRDRRHHRPSFAGARAARRACDRQSESPRFQIRQPQSRGRRRHLLCLDPGARAAARARLVRKHRHRRTEHGRLSRPRRARYRRRRRAVGSQQPNSDSARPAPHPFRQGATRNRGVV